MRCSIFDWVLSDIHRFTILFGHCLLDWATRIIDMEGAFGMESPRKQARPTKCIRACTNRCAWGAILQV